MNVFIYFLGATANVAIRFNASAESVEDFIADVADDSISPVQGIVCAYCTHTQLTF